MLSLPALLILFLVSVLLDRTHAAIHPAKRQEPLTFQDICGADAPNCGNGYCCYKGQECVAANPEPLCRDTIIPDFTQPALDYSSLQQNFALISSLLSPSNLLSLNITLTTPIPTTLPTTDEFTALSTYTDNVVESYSRATPSVVETLSSTAGARAVVATLGVGVVVGGVVGARIGVGVFGGL